LNIETNKSMPTSPVVPEPTDEMKTSKRVLEPYDRVSEVLFGLIMVLSITGSLSVADAGRDDVRTMLIGALGCNLAWGIIDGLLYLMGCLNEKASGIRSLRALRKAVAPAEAHRVIADALSPTVAATLSPAEYESIRQKLLQLPAPPSRARLGKDEWLGALAVAFWVIFTTLPVTAPFMFMTNVARAMRVSNAIAVVLLFVAGWAFGRVTEHRPWLTGVVMVVLGVALVALTIALGG
jgi:VIT1/CCC1 family predicted Fe2+/Mn2+ transporter